MAADVDTQGPVVLIVDDVPDNLAMLHDALSGVGYQVLVALDASAALASLKRVRPDVILLDAVMPGMDGFALCRSLKALEHTRDIPVIFMTGLARPEDVVQGFLAGGVDYVTKPIEPEVLLARMAAHVGNARQLGRARDALESAGLAVIALEAGLAVAWASPRARHWLRGCFPELPEVGDALPRQLLDWAMDQETGEGGGRRPLLLEGGDRALRARWQPGARSGEGLIYLELADAAGTGVPVQRSEALTDREREVLAWLARGKTNRDIGAILGVSPRTVNKHLEHIYVKLGVETRTAAAAIALGLAGGAEAEGDAREGAAQAGESTRSSMDRT